MHHQTREYGRQNQRVVLLFAGWKSKAWMYWLPGQILARNGYHCIVYAYDNNVFSTDTSKTLANLNAVRDAALKQISDLKSQGRHEFAVFGFSLGTVITLMVANKSPDVSKIILNLPGNSPADAAWSWDKVHPSFKQRLVDQDLTLQSLRLIWAPIAPVNNIGQLSGKKLLVYLAEEDQLIPVQQGKELFNRLKQSGYDCHLIVNNNYGHSLAGIYNLLNAKVYLTFLKNML